MRVAKFGLPVNLLGGARFDCTPGWAAGVGLEISPTCRPEGAGFRGGGALED
jgi:hypothetical protein